MTASSWLVHGPPGTGKTRHLAEQCERAAAQHGNDSVAIVSLTRAAAHEIAGRTNLPDDNVGTLHAHCYRALNRPELAETPEGLRAWTDQHPHLAVTGGREQLEDTIDNDPDSPGGGVGDILHAQVQNHRARLTAPQQWTSDQRNFLEQWTAWKRRTGRVDFTDLIERALADVDRHPVAPRVLLVDEAQDLSALELRLIAKWSGRTETTVLSADTDQAIFRWRGASPEQLSSLEYAGERVLEQSYRVPSAVHHLAAQWIRRVTDRKDVAYRPTPHPGVARRLPISLRSCDDLVDHLTADTEQGQTVMLLSTCGYMLTPVIAALRHAGIPFHNPHRRKQGAWNPMRAAKRLAAFLRAREDVWGANARLWTWDDLRQWTDPLQASTALARGAKTLIDERCRPDRFGEDHGNTTVPLDVLLTLLGATSLDHPALHGDVGWWESHLRARHKRTHSYPLAVYRRRGGRALTQQPNVITGTIHSVKGGECSHVYLFPDLSRTAMWDGWHEGGAARDQIVRLGYVAVTRARVSTTILEPTGPEHMPIAEHLNQAGP